MRLPTHQKELITKLALKRQESIASLSKEYGIARKTIYSWIKLYKLAPLRTKSKSLETKYLSGKKHPKEYRHTLRDSVIRFVIKNPELNITNIASSLKAGRHAIYNLLKDLNLTCEVDRLNFSKLYKHPGVLDSEIKLSIVRAVINSSETITSLSKTHNVARKTIYEWVKRFKEEGKVEEKYISGFNHPRAYSASIQDTILNKVVESPTLSIHSLSKVLNLSSHGVFNVLKRYSLTYKAARILYSEGFTREVTKPVTSGIWDRVKSVFESFVPSRAPAPPPVKNIFKAFFGSLTASFVISSIFLVLIRTLSQASGFSEGIGLFFAFSALAMGSFFFLYSLKYYITLGIVLSFSQTEENQNGKKGLKDDLISWIMGNSRKSLNSNGNKVVGLESNLDHVSIKRHPYISIHIPFYNEKYVVERSIQAATNFDYGGEYEVILCDDSTDETSTIINRYQKKCLLKNEKIKVVKGDGWTLTSVEVKPGVTLKHLHRTNRSGFKGAALELARTLSDSRTEFISIFDADFVPYPDTLELFLKYFKVQNDNSEEYTKSNVAVVQGYQWHVLNKSENWVTRGVRSEYSGSYVIERSGTEIYGGLKQISGSVYMIRKDVLDEIGWGTSITEDFELTLKLYEKGYKVVYTPYIQAPAECVSTVKRLIRQRMRWAEGHSQNIKKMFGKLVTSPKLSFMEKIELSYLSPYYLQAFFFLLGTLSWFISETVFRAKLPFWTELWGWSLVLTNMLSLPLVNGVGMFLEESEEKDYMGIASFMALSYVLVPFQAYAALKGFMEEKEGPWFRTPKTGKITDVFTRGNFYRFIQGILPGKAQISNSISGMPSAYLALDSANNRFDSFDIRKQKNRRWLGKAFLTILLIISTTLTSLAPGVSTFISPKPAKAEAISEPIIKPDNSIKDSFADGVIAVNPNKSVYLKGETAKLAIAVLDKEGKMVCDADVKLEIILPSGKVVILSTADKTIIVNRECYISDLNNKQDFETEYKVEETGVIKMNLKVLAKGKEKSLESSFKVEDSTLFSIERNTVTRVYPENKIPVEIIIKANKNFIGTISDEIPSNFILVNNANNNLLNFSEVKNQGSKKIISWNVSLKEGETKTVSYTYDAPDKSPDYYELGPLKFFDEQKNVFYQESRGWQLAIDATRTWDGGGGANTNWSTATNWSNDTAPVAGDAVVFDSTSANNSTWDASGAASIATLTVNATYAGTLTLGRDVSITSQIIYNGANFAHGNHKITFSGGAYGWTPGSVTYYDIDVNLNAGGGLTITGTNGIIAHNLTLTGSSTSQMYTGTLNVTGDITLTNYKGGSALININGTGNQTITGSGTDCVGQLPYVTINKASGNLTLSGNISVRNNWTFTSVGTGSLITANSTVTFCDSGMNGGSGFTVTGTQTLNNVTFVNNNTYTGTWTIGNNTITVNGNLAIKGTGFVKLGSAGSNSTLAVQGDITSTNTGTFPAAEVSGATIILINGTGNQTVTGSGTEGQGTLPAVTINKASGNLTLASVITVGNNWTFTSMGTGSLITTGSTVAFYDNNGNGYSISGTHTLNNVTFVNNNTYGTGGFVISNNTITVNGNLAIKGTGFVKLGSAGSNSTLAVQGDITSTNTGTFPAAEVSGATIILINGTGNQTVTGSGTEGQGTLPAVTINKASGNLTLASVITVGNSWIFTSVGTGSLITTDSTVAFYDSRGNGYPINGTFSLNNVTFTNINTYAAAFTIANTITITGTLAIKGAQLVRLVTGSLNAQGNITVTNTATWPAATNGGSVTININGTGDQTLTGSGTEGQGILPKVTINKASGVMTLASIISVNNTWTFTSVGTGSLVTTNSTVAFYDSNGNGYTISGNHTLNNVTFANNNTFVGSFSIGASSTLIVSGVLAIKGNYFTRITGSGTTSSYIHAKGDITITNTVAMPVGTFSSGATIVINGTGNQTFTGSGVEGAGIIMTPITINKASGNLTLASIITTIGSNWTFTSIGTGSLITTNSTVAFYDSAGNGVVISGTHTLNNVTFSNNNTFASQWSVSALTVTGTLAIKGTTFVKIGGAGPLNAQGDITVTNTAVIPAGQVQTGLPITINGTGNQVFTGSGVEGQGVLPGITINKASGNLTLASVITVSPGNQGGSWIYTSMGTGTFITSGSTLAFYDANGSGYTINGTFMVNNLTFMNSSNTSLSYIIANTVTVNGTLAIKGTARSGIGTGHIYAKGDITITNVGTDTTNGGGNGTIDINGTVDQTLTGSGTADQGPIPNVIVNKASGTLNLVSLITVTGAWTWTAGSLNAGTSTLYIDPAQGTGIINPGNGTYYNVNFSPAIAANIPALGGNLTLSGTLTKGGHASSSFSTGAGLNYSITTGNLIVSAGIFYPRNSIITISGNYTNSATMTKEGSTFVFNGTGTSTIDPGASSFNNFTSNTASKSLIFSKDNSTVVSGTLTLSGGSCNTPVSLNSSDGSSQFTINATGTKTVSYVRVANSIATTSITAGNSVDGGNNTGWTISSDTCMESTSSSATAYSFQRKTWYDGTQIWRSFYNGTEIQFWYSTDWGTNWTQNASATIAVSTSDFSIEADASNAFLTYTDGYDVKAISASNYPNTSFSWNLATEMVSNPGFETAGSGGADVFANWVEAVASGASLTDETSIVHSGGHAVKLTRGTTGGTYVRQNITVVPGNTYNVSFWTRGDGTNAGRYQFVDSTHSANIIPITSTGISGSTYTQFSTSFTAPSGCVTVQVILFDSAGAQGIYAYFDDVSVLLATIVYNHNPSNTFINDGFETGGFSADWNGGQETDGGNLSVATAAKLHGNYGLSNLINDTNNLYTGWAGTNKTEVRIRFYIDPNTVSIPDGNGITLVNTWNSGWSNAFSIALYNISSTYKIYFNEFNWSAYLTATISDAPHCVEFHWKAATAPGANDGILELWVDGASVGSSTNVDSDGEAVGNLLFGALYIPSSTAGTIYLDDFIANNVGTEIGPLPNSYSYPTITRDSSGNVWVSATHNYGSDYIINTIKSTSANNVTAWGTANVMDTSTNSNKYGVIVGRTSGSVYAVWIDNATIEGKNYSGSSWDGSPTLIATGLTGMTNNMSAVADSSGNVHLLYIDSSDHVVYQEFTSSWQTAVTLDSNTGNDYVTISLNTLNGDLYALWVRSNTIYYKIGASTYTSGNWDTNATAWKTAGTNTWVTSNYSGPGLVMAEWTAGPSSSYTINWDAIIVPELAWLFFAIGPILPLLSRIRRRKK